MKGIKQLMQLLVLTYLKYWKNVRLRIFFSIGCLFPHIFFQNFERCNLLAGVTKLLL